MVSVVLGTYQRLAFLKLTLESVRQELKATPHEIVVVDGGSTDDSLEWLVKQKDVLTIVQHNRGQWNGKQIGRQSWGFFMNLAFRAASSKYVCMISDDCLLVPGAIMNGIERFEKRLAEGVNIGALAFYWRNWPEQQKYWVGRTPGGRIFVNHGLFLKSALEKAGYIDQDNFFFYHADADLALKLWNAGYVCEDCTDCYIEHYSHANVRVRSSNFERERADWSAFQHKWQGKFFDAIAEPEGTWIERSYDDPNETARRFRPVDRKRATVRYFLDRIVKPGFAALGLLGAARAARNALRSRMDAAVSGFRSR